MPGGRGTFTLHAVWWFPVRVFGRTFPLHWSPVWSCLHACTCPARVACRAWRDWCVGPNSRWGMGPYLSCSSLVVLQQMQFVCAAGVSMSEATTNILRQVMAAGGFISTVVSASRAPLRARPVRGTKPFDWNREQGEGSSANASRTVDYFNSIVPPPCNNHGRWSAQHWRLVLVLIGWQVRSAEQRWQGKPAWAVRKKTSFLPFSVQCGSTASRPRAS